ncbi:unnamed protein product [Brachionus calyciflorus]|uniref:LysM domain-containing protein n=1 Tax=Brachionus calyciflorus TaxID=104777 RepID=A0A813MC47_9BILA|nr:unnamed protein product [Brachionus calyciflorus]
MSEKLPTKYVIFMILILCISSKPVNSRMFMPGLTNYFSCDKIHIVQEHETCWTIARQYHIPVQLIKWKNEIINCNKLIEGKRICVSNWI